MPTSKWKNNGYAVIVATRAFGLGIKKPDVRDVIQNGLPPPWIQEIGQASRDGKSSEAHIFYSDDNIHVVEGSF